MLRILYVHGGRLLFGGTESYIMNYLRHFDRDRLQVDVAVHDDGHTPGVYDAEVAALGGRVIPVPVKGRDSAGNRAALLRLLREGGYGAVHAHMDAGNARVLSLAKECGVPVRVSHSHNTATQTDSVLKKLYNAREKRRIPGVATHLLACSDPAGKWLYGRHPFQVVPNAIDTARFAFDPAARAAVRAACGVPPDAVVLGHVGRFAYQKNHGKLIDIFAAVVKRKPSARLWLFGEGETRAAVEAQVAARGLRDAVRFFDPTPEVARYLQGMDAFVLPSRFEGLPVVLVEAQAAGLPCVVADTVAPASRLTEAFAFLPPDASEERWAEVILQAASRPRADTRQTVAAAGYDIAQAAAGLQRLYSNSV